MSNLVLDIAIKNVRKFNSLELAQASARNQKYWVDVLMGDNGKYWVPGTNREQGALVKAGYEKV